MRHIKQSTTIVNNSSDVVNSNFNYSVTPFNTAFKAVIFNDKGMKTHAFGRNKRIAKKNAQRLFFIKYPNFSL